MSRLGTKLEEDICNYLRTTSKIAQAKLSYTDVITSYQLEMLYVSPIITRTINTGIPTVYHSYWRIAYDKLLGIRAYSQERLDRLK